jgi:4-aminobutyrate aminotransferase-like enzyme
MGSQLAGGDLQAKQWIAEDHSRFVQVPFPDGFRVMETGFEHFETSLAAQGVLPEEVALVLMESYQGGGASFAPAPYVQALRAWCDRHGVLLCMDEVQAGFGRTGRFFAFEHYDIRPDLIACGKAISGSLPLSAVIGPAHLLDQYAPGSMTSTHGGHVVACAAGLAHLELLLGEDLVQRAASEGQAFGEQLRELARRHPFVGAVHGRGLVYGLHIVGADGRTPNAQRARSIVWGCYERGLLMFAPVGVGGATVKICPPLSTPTEALEEGIAVLYEALEAAALEEIS